MIILHNDIITEEIPFEDTIVLVRCGERITSLFRPDHDNVKFIDNLSDIKGSWELWVDNEHVGNGWNGFTITDIDDIPYTLRFIEQPVEEVINRYQNVNFGTSNHKVITIKADTYYSEVEFTFTIPPFPIWLNVEKDRSYVSVYTESEEDLLQLRLML